LHVYPCITDLEVAERMHRLYQSFAILANSFALAVALAMRQPDDVDVNEILFRPTRQEY
jgi:NADP-dependent 3-hydroxy acid dehydrogenase YdfG